MHGKPSSDTDRICSNSNVNRICYECSNSRRILRLPGVSPTRLVESPSSKYCYQYCYQCYKATRSMTSQVLAMSRVLTESVKIAASTVESVGTAALSLLTFLNDH